MKLMEQVRGLLRAKHYAYRTEQVYVYWILRYILARPFRRSYTYV